MKKINRNLTLFVLTLMLYSFGAYSQISLSKPKPGNYYQIKSGDNLLSVVGKAFNVKAGSLRLRLAKGVNNYPLNKHLHIPPRGDFKKKHFSKGIVTFLPKFNCTFNQEFAISGEKKCYGRIFIPDFTKIPKAGGNTNHSFISACSKSSSSGLAIRVNQKLEKPSKDPLRWTARGRGSITSGQAYSLIDWFNEESKYQVNPYQLEKYMPQLDIGADILINKKLGTIDQGKINNWLRKTYVPRRSTSLKGTPQLVYFAYPAEFGAMFQKRSTLNICLKDLYKKAGLTDKKLKKGEYWLMVYIAIPPKIWAKVSRKKSISENAKELDSYQAVKKFHLPKWLPREAREWGSIFTNDTEVKRFKTNDPIFGDVIVWKRKGVVEAYQEYPAEFKYYLKQVQHNSLYSWADDDSTAKIVQSTYLQWNGDMSYYVETGKMSPSLAKIKVLENSIEVAKQTVKLAVLVLNGAYNYKEPSFAFVKSKDLRNSLAGPVSNFVKWLGQNKERLDL